METLTIVIDGGRISAVDNPALADLAAQGTARRRRASHVLPINPVLRLAFRAIRACVRDDSRAAAFTRRWRCLWRADLAPSGGPILQPFPARADAIAAEVAWLNERLASDADHGPACLCWNCSTMAGKIAA